jgi:predicted N-acetyltransferase YhbS
MPEIRRIREGEGPEAAELWDRAARETPDGGPLKPRGRERIARMLDASAWHRDTFTLVAVEDHRLVGFLVTRVDVGDGLLPGALGLIEEGWPVTGELAGRLVDAAVAELRRRDASVIRVEVDLDAPDEQAFWRERGWEAEQVRFALYP